MNGAGAGHGGQGGKGPDHGGGMFYGSVTRPVEFGRPASAGIGSDYDAIGGGRLFFDVAKTFIIDGELIL